MLSDNILLALMCLAVTGIFADDYRLPKTVIPENYVLNLTFPESAFKGGKDGATFSGQVLIKLRTLQVIEEIKFHASQEFITINTISIDDVKLAITFNPDTDIVTAKKTGVKYSKDKTYLLKIGYAGNISTNDNHGIFRRSYNTTGQDQQTNYFLATQFEAIAARKAFPCFDEPSFKSHFEVSVTYPKGYSALFNTEKYESNLTSEGEIIDYFKKSPKMSTYLFALVISEFGSTDVEPTQDTKLKIWSKEQISSASRNYAAEISPKILKALENYTGRNYSKDIPKIDLVAIPTFNEEAMENWGLIIYKEGELPFDEANTVVTTKQTITNAIAHTFAHQWFGNLITCAWWSEVYLNEGFATYFQYLIMKEIEPAWQTEKLLIVNSLQFILVADSSIETQALKSKASTPDEISGKFGDISYAKGASIIRMMAHIMGERNFKKAVRNYVQSKLKYSTATTSQMLEIFQNHVDPKYSLLPEGASLETVMQNWIEKPGYPLVSVSLKGRNLTISQKRFLVSGEDIVSKWYIPITIAESKSKNKFAVTAPAFWLTPKNSEITIELLHKNSWVLLNTFQTGYYRVNYDSTLWSALAAALLKDNFDGIIEENRAQIVDDAFNMIKINKLKYSKVFEIVEFLKSESGYFTWVPAFKGFQFLWLKLQGHSKVQAKVRDHVLRLMNHFYKTTPIRELKNEVVYTQRQILSSNWACTFGENTCVSEMKRHFKETVLAKNQRPPKDIRMSVYCNALRYTNDTSDYDRLWQIYVNTFDKDEELNIVQGFGCSLNPAKLNELLLETLKDNSKVIKQGYSFIFFAVYSRSLVGTEVSLEFVQENFKKIQDKFGPEESQNTFKFLAAYLTTPAQIKKLEQIIASNAEFLSEWKSTGEEALTIAKSNIKWFEDHEADLKSYYNI